MSEKDEVYKSQIKQAGIFNFRDFYKFCYEWLKEEAGLSDIYEEKYGEKITGNQKEIKIEWKGEKKFTDYFKEEIKVAFEITDLVEVEMEQDGRKIKTNKGRVKVTVKGTLIKDYDGKFEKSAFQKFLRAIYEKWIIASRVDKFQNTVIGHCDDFLGQMKAWLDLEGKVRHS